MTAIQWKSMLRESMIGPIIIAQLFARVGGIFVFCVHDPLMAAITGTINWLALNPFHADRPPLGVWTLFVVAISLSSAALWGLAGYAMLRWLYGGELEVKG